MVCHCSQSGCPMRKSQAFYKFVVRSLLVAGLFGAVHDQISYSVSSEYFTKLKFVQFMLTDSIIPERIRASLVGVLASWWMGIPLGILTGLAGYIHPTPVQMHRALTLSIAVIVTFTLGFALAGLAYGFFVTATTLNPADYASWYIPRGLQEPRHYLCAGHMHNAAYVGGALSIPAAWVFHILYKRRMKKFAGTPGNGSITNDKQR